MDADSWQGTDRVGCDFPDPAEVDDKVRIYKRKDGV